MMRRMIGPALFGIVGTAILLSLGIWQMQRLEWKQAILAEIDARIAGAPVPLPQEPVPAEDRFRPVVVEGSLGAEELHVLTSTRAGGPGFRVISPFVTEDGRRILIDRGFVPEAAKAVPRPAADDVTVVGNLHWPDETDAFTPAPEREDNLWYARDVPAMAEALGTEPVLVVAREVPGDVVTPLPIDTSGVPNRHLEYAVTWFSLAASWIGMTALLLWRMRQRPE